MEMVGDHLQEMSDPVFGKIRKNISKFWSAKKISQSVKR